VWIDCGNDVGRTRGGKLESANSRAAVSRFDRQAKKTVYISLFFLIIIIIIKELLLLWWWWWVWRTACCAVFSRSRLTSFIRPRMSHCRHATQCHAAHAAQSQDIDIPTQACGRILETHVHDFQHCDGSQLSDRDNTVGRCTLWERCKCTSVDGAGGH
jgi:hypothetical protein